MNNAASHSEFVFVSVANDNGPKVVKVSALCERDAYVSWVDAIERELTTEAAMLEVVGQ